MTPGSPTRARGLAHLQQLAAVLACVCPVAFALFPAATPAQIASDSRPQPQLEGQTQEDRDANCRIVYLGIVGGLETANNKRSGVVQIRDILRGRQYPDVCAVSVSPYVWPSGLHWVLGHFPNHAGQLTTDELSGAPKVIIVGHSLGGWAALSVARGLKLKSIPIELTVQIDSVGITDRTVPSNVKAAAIFHARDALILLTTKSINLEDPSHTRLIENVLVRDAGHESVTRDPRIHELVLGTVELLRSGAALRLDRSEQTPVPADEKAPGVRRTSFGVMQASIASPQETRLPNWSNPALWLLLALN